MRNCSVLALLLTFCLVEGVQAQAVLCSAIDQKKCKDYESDSLFCNALECTSPTVCGQSRERLVNNGNNPAEALYGLTEGSGHRGFTSQLKPCLEKKACSTDPCYQAFDFKWYCSGPGAGGWVPFRSYYDYTADPETACEAGGGGGGVS